MIKLSDIIEINYFMAFTYDFFGQYKEFSKI